MFTKFSHIVFYILSNHRKDKAFCESKYVLTQNQYLIQTLHDTFS